MIIDNKKKLDISKDKLIWIKIISIFPLAKNNGIIVNKLNGY